ncbi:hypothetical protein OH77DRAFT_1593879 [Trametes cingulata]|nr:hypothetical protein OH77DRAFT_1593879 [Trametes cingulata]
MRSSHNWGPFITVLGTDLAGVHDQRPPNTAVGKFKPLLPIVLTCAFRSNAEAVDVLNRGLFLRVPPGDAMTMMKHINHEHGIVSKVRLTAPAPYFAICSGVETGIYIRYKWESLVHLVNPRDDRWRGFDTLRGALTFMLDKQGAGSRRIDGAGGGGGGEENDEEKPESDTAFAVPGEPNISACSRPRTGSPTKLATPTKPSAQASTAPSVKSPSPTKAVPSGKRVTLMLPKPSSLSSPAPPSPVKTPNRSVATPVGILRRSFAAHTISGDVVTPREGDSNEDMQYGQSSNPRQATADIHVDPDSEEVANVVAVLQSMIRKPPIMTGSTGSAYPVNFGRRAEIVLMQLGAAPQDAWTVLQVLIHTDTAPKFAFHLGLHFGWSTEDCVELLEAIDFRQK